MVSSNRIFFSLLYIRKRGQERRAGPREKSCQKKEKKFTKRKRAS
jgi:hypothetical protein